jgi:hypothetical protein
MSTAITGDEELSTCPTIVLVMTGTPSAIPSSVLATCHVTAGVAFGVRP